MTEMESPQAPVDMETDDLCWICLDDTRDRDPLVSPCRCPRKVHPRCLARWQLQQAGRPEETNCRFCHHNLVDWKQSLTPENLRPEVQRVQPIMVVYFEGQIHRIPVKQGPDGLKEFTQRIRDLFRLPEDVDISLTFGCKEPLSGQHLKLEGVGAFDAAVHCASVAAAERQQKLKSGGGAAPNHGSGGGAPPEDEESAAEAEAGQGSGLQGQVPTRMEEGDDAGEALAQGQHHHHHGAQHPLHHHYPSTAATANRHNGLNHPDSSAPGCGLGVAGLTASASAPASAQTSGGGSADSASSFDGPTPYSTSSVVPPYTLHPAASAPALGLCPSSDALLGPGGGMGAGGGGGISGGVGSGQLGGMGRMMSGTPAGMGIGPEGSYPGCCSLSEEPASAARSARTSSGGGSVGRRESSPALDAATPPAATTSPFQAAALGDGRYTDLLARAAGSASAADGALRALDTVPPPAASAAAAAFGMTAPPPLAGCISEPTGSAGGAASGRVPSPSYTSAVQHPSGQPYFGGPQHQLASASSAYASPAQLPPLPPTGASRIPFASSSSSSLASPHRPTSPCPAPSAAAASPPGGAQTSHPCEPPTYHPYHHLQQHRSSSPAVQLYGSPATRARGPSCGSGSPRLDASLSPATPSRPTAPTPRVGTPSTPVPPSLPRAPLGLRGGVPSGPDSPTLSSPARNPRAASNHLSASDADVDGDAASDDAMSYGGGSGGSAAAGGDANRQPLYRSGSAASGSTPPRSSDGLPLVAGGGGGGSAAVPHVSTSPLYDDGLTSAQLGSLTGRLKCSLKAFSRKVARSLNFNNSSTHGNNSGSHRHAAGSSGLAALAEAADGAEGAELHAASHECGGAAAALAH